MAVNDDAPWTIRPGAETDVPSVLALWLKAASQTSAIDTEQARRGALGSHRYRRQADISRFVRMVCNGWLPGPRLAAGT